MANNQKILLATDMDGTIIPPKTDFNSSRKIKEFNNEVRKNGNIILAYVTGRHLELALKGVKENGLIMPDVFVCDVGTSIYFKRGKKWEIDENYRKILKKSWAGFNRKELGRLLSGVKKIKEQEREKLKEFKQSYYVSLKTDINFLLKEINGILKKRGVKINAIYSVDRIKKVGLLDILPKSASKEFALRRLKNKFRISADKVIYAGDSGNDFEAFVSGFRSIVVGNTAVEIKRAVVKEARKRAVLKRVYFADLLYSDGVMEGLRHFNAVEKKSKGKGLYIQMHSMHGLFRSKQLELGRDEDTGGQIVYVLKLAKSFGKLKEVGKVDIITRKIIDSKYPGYSKDVERVDDKINIVRISCGPKKYIKKVKLWPYIDEFVENCEKYINKIGRSPDILHSNYADSGYVCARLSRDLKIPQVHTAHSLGKTKMKYLGVNEDNFEAMDKIFNFSKRLKAEQLAIKNAKAIIVSSKEEQKEQYAMYDINTSSKKFHLIWPGVDYEKFCYYRSVKYRGKLLEARKKLESVLRRNFTDTSKPIIVAMSRLAPKKNFISLVKAFAFDGELNRIANLLIAPGSLKNLSESNGNLISEMKSVIKKRKLNGKAFILGDLNQSEVSEIYWLAARSQGIFVNPALIEPFGLTLIEAAASGLPIVATKNGGPVNIIKNCKNGLLINPRSAKNIAEAVKKILKDEKLWKRFSENGTKNARKYYSWETAAKSELKVFKDIIGLR